MALGATEKEITVFVTEIIAGKSQREAYRIARPLSRRWQDKTVDERASVLFKKDKVQTRYAELLAKATAAVEKECVLTIADKRRRLLEIVNNPDEKTDSILKAIDLDNKMEGVYTNKTELSGGIEYVLNWGDGPDGG